MDHVIVSIQERQGRTKYGFLKSHFLQKIFFTQKYTKTLTNGFTPDRHKKQNMKSEKKSL